MQVKEFILKNKSVIAFVFTVFVSILVAAIDKYIVLGNLYLFTVEFIAVLILSIPGWLSLVFKRYGFFFTYMAGSLVLFVLHIISSLNNKSNLRMHNISDGIDWGSTGPAAVLFTIMMSVFIFGALFIISAIVEFIRVLIIAAKNKITNTRLKDGQM